VNLDLPTAEDLEVERSQQKRQQTTRLTEKQARMGLELLLDPTKSDIQAAKDAGYSVTEGAKTSILKHQLKGKFGELLRKLHITEKTLAQTIAEGLTAERSMVIIERVYKDGKPIAEKSKIINIPDHATRHRYLSTCLQLGNYFPATKVKVDEKRSTTITFIQGMTEAQKRAALKQVSDEIDPDYEVGPNAVN
jgi:hypothetical protein